MCFIRVVSIKHIVFIWYYTDIYIYIYWHCILTGYSRQKSMPSTIYQQVYFLRPMTSGLNISGHSNSIHSKVNDSYPGDREMRARKNERATDREREKQREE